LAVRVDEDVVHAPPQVGVAFAGGEEAVEVAEGGHDVGLVQRAGAAHHVAQVGRGARREAGEAVGGLRVGPAAAGGEPAGRREVVEGDDRLEAVLAAGRAHAPVVVERRAGELPVLGLDAAPLEREAVGVETQPGEEPDVLGPAVPVVAGVAARLLAGRGRVVLPHPPVVVPVAALDLMGGGGGAPHEALGNAAGGPASDASGGGAGGD